MTQEKHAILAQSITPAPRCGEPSHARRFTLRHLSWAGAGVIALPVAFFVGVVTAFGTVQDSEPLISQSTVVEQLALQATAISTLPETEFWTEDGFDRGDTFAGLLERLGVDDLEADQLRRAAAASGPLRGLRPGTTVQAKVNAAGQLQSLWFIVGRDSIVTLDRRADGNGFVAAEQAANLERHVVMKSGEIRSSLFAATDAADIPDNIATQIADIFGGDVDFHRDLRRGDRFSVVYENLRHAGRDVKSGQLLAAEFVNNGRTFRAVWYADAQRAASGERGGYFTPEGRPLRKAFLRSPLEFSRITSGFGLRMHPIQQRWRAHTGVDYAAPTGTRVRATGDGVVEFAGVKGGYGNVLVLRHSGGYTTWYAHLSGFARGLTHGIRVSQGDVVAFVGSTGWATGPHLHYEFRANGEYRNPLAIAFPAAQPLTPDRLPGFLQHASQLSAQLDLLRTSNLALLE